MHNYPCQTFFNMVEAIFFTFYKKFLNRFLLEALISREISKSGIREF